MPGTDTNSSGVFSLGDALGCAMVKVPQCGTKEPESPGCPFHFDSQSAISTTRDFIGSSCLSYWHIFDTICTSHFARRTVTITISYQHSAFHWEIPGKMSDPKLVLYLVNKR